MHQGIWKDDSRYLLGYLFVAVLIFYMQDSSVKRGYHVSKDILSNGLSKKERGQRQRIQKGADCDIV